MRSILGCPFTLKEESLGFYGTPIEEVSPGVSRKRLHGVCHGVSGKRHDEVNTGVSGTPLEEAVSWSIWKRYEVITGCQEMS